MKKKRKFFFKRTKQISVTLASNFIGKMDLNEWLNEMLK